MLLLFILRHSDEIITAERNGQGYLRTVTLDDEGYRIARADPPQKVGKLPLALNFNRLTAVRCADEHVPHLEAVIRRRAQCHFLDGVDLFYAQFSRFTVENLPHALHGDGDTEARLFGGYGIAAAMVDNALGDTANGIDGQNVVDALRPVLCIACK